MTNGQVAIDTEDPNLQAQLGQRLVTDAQNGVANPEQSLTADLVELMYLEV